MIPSPGSLGFCGNAELLRTKHSFSTSCKKQRGIGTCRGFYWLHEWKVTELRTPILVCFPTFWHSPAATCLCNADYKHPGSWGDLSCPSCWCHMQFCLEGWMVAFLLRLPQLGYHMRLPWTLQNQPLCNRQYEQVLPMQVMRMPCCLRLWSTDNSWGKKGFHSCTFFPVLAIKVGLSSLESMIFIVRTTLKDIGPASSKHITADTLWTSAVCSFWDWIQLGANVHKISGPH